MTPYTQMALDRYGNLIALFAGALLPLAFSPIGLFFLAIVSPALLLAVWLVSTPKQAFFRGFYYGLAVFGVGVSWVFISIHRYGNTNIFISSFLTLLMITYLALYPAVQGYLLTRFFPNNNRAKFLLAFPASWVLFEWLRTWIITGFPWLLLGYSQTNSPLHSYAPLAGLYGVTFIVAFSSGLLVMAADEGFRQWHKSVFPLIIIWIGGWMLLPVHWTQPIGTPLTTSLVQGNIPQSIKWNPQQANASLHIYQQLTDPFWKSDIIIWPESAITFLLPDASDYLANLSAKANLNHSALITGIPIPEFNAATNQTKYYNGMIVVGNGNGQYEKQHLVPFGEYVPLENILRGLFGFFNLPMSAFSSGPAHQPLLFAHNVLIAPFVCYEIVYADLVLATMPQAQLLVTVSDDTWFGNSLALGQHLQMGQFWAQVTGRYLIFSTNSGTTAIVNPDGTLQATIPAFEATVLTGKVQAMVGAPPAVRLGNHIPLLLMGLLLLIAWLLQRKGVKR